MIQSQYAVAQNTHRQPLHAGIKHSEIKRRFTFYYCDCYHHLPLFETWQKQGIDTEARAHN